MLAVGFLGPIVARAAAWLLGPAVARLSPVGGLLAAANLRTATRRFSSASTPLVLTVAMSCTLLFSTTTQDHAVSQQRRAALTGELAVTSTGPGLTPATLADVRATPGVRSAAALTPTTLGPSLGISDDTAPRPSSTAARAQRSTPVSPPDPCRRCTGTRSRSVASALTPLTPTQATASR